METARWNKLQEELLDEMVNHKANMIMNISNVIRNIKPYTEVWQGLYDLLMSSCEYFDKYSRVDIVKIIEHNNHEYLFIKLDAFNYHVIDLESERSLSNDEVINTFDEDFFCLNFGTKKTGNYETIYMFDETSEPKEIIDYCLERMDVLENKSRFAYSLSNEEGKITLIVYMDSSELCFSFYADDLSRVNHVFVNRNLEPMMVSNPTGNKEELKEMFKKIKDIYIPVNKLPSFMMNTYGKRKVYTKKEN